MSYDSRNDQVFGRELKVQRLVIPFKVTHSATPSAVVLSSDEPSMMFMQSEGNDQISPEVAAIGDTATYSYSANDATGVMNIYIKLSDQAGDPTASKVCRASCSNRVTGAIEPVKIGSASGLSSFGNLMLTLDSATDFATTDYDACLEVDYVDVK